MAHPTIAWRRGSIRSVAVLILVVGAGVGGAWFWVRGPGKSSAAGPADSGSTAAAVPPATPARGEDAAVPAVRTGPIATVPMPAPTSTVGDPLMVPVPDASISAACGMTKPSVSPLTVALPTPTAASDDTAPLLAAAVKARAQSPYAAGTYATVDGTRYVLNGPGVTLADRTSWTLVRLSDPSKPAFSAVWTTGPSTGNPELPGTNPKPLPALSDYGTVDDEGRRLLIGVRVLGDATLLSEYGEVTDPPGKPTKKLTLTRLP